MSISKNPLISACAGAALMMAFLTFSVAADEFSGLVVGVSDGDTLTILDAGNNQHRIRLAEIDAPEKNQPYGQRSKQALSAMCYRQVAVTRITGRDHYGRQIGHVLCAGVDANREQVRTGMAWVYTRYATDKTLDAIQAAAMQQRLGLWADPNPVPPWKWRKR